LGFVCKFSAPEYAASKPISVLGVKVPLEDVVNYDEELSFLDGLSNGTSLVGSLIKAYFAAAWSTYTYWFSDSIITIWNLIWLFIGIPIALILAIFFTLFAGIVYFFKLLFINASFLYYIGFLLSFFGSFVIWGIAGEEEGAGKGKPTYPREEQLNH
jgi:hypothetical protein